MLRALPGKRDVLITSLELLELGTFSTTPDLLRVETFVPVDDPDAVVLATTWPSVEHFERWASGSAWQEARAAIAPLLEGDPEWQVYRLVDALV
jgi:quinol monooxygenase YgiN